MGVLCLLVDYVVPIVWTRSPYEAILLLLSIATREQNGKHHAPRIQCEKKPPIRRELQEYIVAGLPTIDTVIARRLLPTFTTIERVFAVSIVELQQIEGIGDLKSKKIRGILICAYDSNHITS